MDTQQLYNTPVEISARLLVLLNELEGVGVDKEKMMYLDHVALHTTDFGGMDSLHAPVPKRNIQVYAKSNLITSALSLLLSKDLVLVKPTNEGFLYFKSDLSDKFLSYFESKYFAKLVERIKWVVTEYSSFSSVELRKVIDQRFGDWGGEVVK